MGVINVTPNSFYAGSRCHTPEQALTLAKRMQLEGASIIDIGGEATNPTLDLNQASVSAAEELDRVIGSIELIKANLDIDISIDTSKPEVMAAAVKAGATMINDQRALILPGALEMVAALNVPVCLMHMYGPSRQPNNDKAQTLNEIKDFLHQRIVAAIAAGISRQNIIIDPGFGHGNYGKSTAENCYILQHLNQIVAMGYPVMVGLSRKTLIGEILGVSIEERLAGSLALAILAAINGAHIIRVHDVKATAEAVSVCHAVMNPEFNR